jgi:hypothetical protein
MTELYEPQHSGDAGSDVDSDRDVIVLEAAETDDAQTDGADEEQSSVEDEENDLDEEQSSEPAGTDAGEMLAVDEPYDSQPGPGSGGNDAGAAEDAGREWLDIQAMFVDDPRGAVQLAAAAADSAADELVTALQERQAALAPANGAASADGTPADPAETEQLRSALRGYRALCQDLAQVSASLPAPRTIAS